MTETSTVNPTPLPFPASIAPAQLARAWPADRPLAAILSAAPHANRGPRWSILAEPVDRVVIPHHRVRCAADLLPPGAGPDPSSADRPPIPGWIGCLAYEAGAALEPAAIGPPDPDAPAAVWLRCTAAYIHDARTGGWSIAGDPAAPPSLDAPPPPPLDATLGRPRSRTGRDAYQEAVRRTVDYIRAGDIYQANIAHRLLAPFSGRPRAALLGVLARARPWHGAWLEWDDPAGRHAICSISPELFLDYDPATRRVVTRPMKGTAPAERRSVGEAPGPSRPLADPKSRAELAMIVDLMRNDLGRVAALGSVRVDDPRTLENHGDLVQGVATVSAALREGLGLADLLRATFPAGSITGCPKIRAMQIVEELEPVSRGPAFGSLGVITDDGRMTLNVAIRTAFLSGVAGPDPGSFTEGLLDYPVGAGIVADSDPEAEWRETLAKARVIEPLIGSVQDLC